MGMMSAVFLAAMMPATFATASTSPFGNLPGHDGLESRRFHKDGPADNSLSHCLSLFAHVHHLCPAQFIKMC